MQKQLYKLTDKVIINNLNNEMSMKFLEGDEFIISKIIFKKGFIFYNIKVSETSKNDYIVSQDDISLKI